MQFKRLILTTIFAGVSGLVVAQPTGSELAKRILEKQSEQLSRIERVTISFSMDEGPLPGMTFSDRYQRVERNGRYVLEPIGDSDMEVFSVSVRDTLAELTEKARSITQERMGGQTVYVITVDDAETLRSLSDIASDEDDMNFDPKEAVIWLDARDLVPHKMTVRQDEGGGEIAVEVRFEDYQMHRGFPVAHRTILKISGMQQMFDSNEMSESIQELRKLQQQLEQMPPEQRAMIEQMLAPQIAQLEQMISTGESSMSFRVTNVVTE